MPTAPVATQRSPADAAAASSGYQGSAPSSSTQPSERPASADMTAETTPAAEPVEQGKDAKASADAAAEGDTEGGSKATGDDADANIPKEVKRRKHTKKMQHSHLQLCAFIVHRLNFELSLYSRSWHDYLSNLGCLISDFLETCRFHCVGSVVKSCKSFFLWCL